MSNHDQNKSDEGTIEVLLERAMIRVPNLLAMKERLLEGATLSDIEITEMESIFAHVKDIRGLMGRHPELHEIAVKMISLYDEITELALANERQVAKPPRFESDDQ